MKRIPVKIKIRKGCWEVISHSLSRDGYPRFRVFGKICEMYREMYKSCYGKIPKGKCIRHMCNNRLCINPEHLKVGTQKQNMRDMKLAGRARNKWTGKLT